MPYNVSGFAKNHLHRSGWVEGKGLGRNEDGMSEAIKVKIKADNAGIGHDPAEKFTFHWWEHAFSKSAQNIKVTECDIGVEVSVKSETEKASTRKQDKKLLKKKLLYGSFVKSGVLEHGEIQKPPTGKDESDSSDSETTKEKTVLTDEQLLAACGGRTAHKGARHGVNLSGKLARLQEQEQDSAEDKVGKRKKKKKRKRETESHSLETADTSLKNEDSRPDKRKKCIDVKLGENLVSDIEVLNSKKKKLKKSKRKVTVSDVDGLAETERSGLKVKKKKKKCRISLTEVERKD